MTGEIRGSFEVAMTPQPHAEGVGDPAVGRMALDKTFRGDLEARSLGQMLAFRSATPGSAGYVAMERVEGTLLGRAGSFVLQHNGVMNRGEPGLTVAVVPDSGTGGLTGLAGSMKILVEGKAHIYEFSFTLPDAGPAA